MTNIATLLTEHMDIWTAADTDKKLGRGRASSNTGSVYGVKKLRELILELAVRGKLVSQDPNDEPASELLKRIQAEKAKLIAEGKLKKEKLLAPIVEGEKPFEIPSGWEWVRLGDVLEMINGRAFKPTDWITKGLPIVRIQNLNNSEASFNYCDENNVDARHIINKGSFLISWSGTPGTSFGAFIWNGSKAALNQHIFSCFQIGNPYFDKFLELAINTRLEELISKAHGGVGLQHITKGKLETLTLVVPPISEQHRIVDKVDELMALCDQLEQQHSNAREAHETLVTQLLVTLTHSQNATEFNAYWQRIYVHFDVIFTTEASIDALKQTLLQLAIMGKLVPQDPTNEPASELLKRIHAEKAKLKPEGKLKNEIPLAPISEEERPFQLPKSWSWTRLTDTAFFQEGPGILAKDFRESGVPLIRIAGMHKDLVSLDGCNFLDEDMVNKKWSHFKLELGDVVLSSSASLGKVAKVGIETVGCIAYTGLIRFRPYTSIDVDYLILFLNSNEFLSQINKSKTGAAIMHFGPTHLNGMLVPLPPIAEQHRIVAKVDALMELCNQLKTSIQQSKQQQQAIADALVAQALA